MYKKVIFNLKLWSLVFGLLGFLFTTIFFKAVVYLANQGTVGSGAYGSFYYALIDPKEEWKFTLGIVFIIISFVISFFDLIKSKY